MSTFSSVESASVPNRKAAVAILGACPMRRDGRAVALPGRAVMSSSADPLITMAITSNTRLMPALLRQPDCTLTLALRAFHRSIPALLHRYRHMNG